MILADVRDQLAVALRTIPGLRVSDTIPSAVNPPQVGIGLGAMQYDADFAAGVRAEWIVVLYLSRGSGDDRAQYELDRYLSNEDDWSIKLAVETDLTLGGTVDSVAVLQSQEPVTFTSAGVDYIGVEFTVEVIGT